MLVVMSVFVQEIPDQAPDQVPDPLQQLVVDRTGLQPTLNVVNHVLPIMIVPDLIVLPILVPAHVHRARVALPAPLVPLQAPPVQPR